MTRTPLPPSGQFIASVRRSCHEARVAHGIQIPEENIERLLLSPAFTTTYQRIAANSHGLAFPLNFPSPLAELNVLSILSLLNIGSGFRTALHEQTGRGAWDSIRTFVFGLYLTSSSGDGDLLSAQGMKQIGDAQIAELLGVNVHVEKAHDSIAGLTVGEVGGAGWEIVQLLKQLMNETGKILVENGYSDLGSFVVEALKEGQNVATKTGDKDALAEVVLERLVTAFPGFQDMEMINDQPIYCFKKALFVIYGVAIRFGSKSTAPFPVPDASTLPVCTDNVLPSMLVHLGVLDLSACEPALKGAFEGAGAPQALEVLLAPAPDPVEGTAKSAAKVVPKEGPVLTTEQAYILRAAAIDACELIVETARSMDEEELRKQGLVWIKDIVLPDVDTWLWAVAKDRPDYRKLDRFVHRCRFY
ncbi:hypothetical protein PENSPDRAFT_646344 [Peniophora sp. CONT]|nr:hypothetical protein PENSPDRAFT_646344 [Peniophora sp. CONT]